MTKIQIAVRTTLGQISVSESLGQTDQFRDNCRNGGGYIDTRVGTDGATILRCVNGSHNGDVLTVPSAGSSANASSSYCIRFVQQTLVSQGKLTSASITGTWNDETSRVLDANFGPNWRTFPGGACALVGALRLTPGITPGVNQANTVFGVNTSTALLIGGGLLVAAILFARR